MNRGECSAVTHYETAAVSLVHDMKKFSRPDRVRTGIQAHRREMAKANAPKAKGKTKAKAAAGKMHGDLQKSAKDSTLEHSLFAAFNTD